MALKILLPVLPTDRFYDAVVAVGDLLAEKGGTVTFLFTTVRPPPGFFEKQPDQSESASDISINVDDDIEQDWREDMRQGLGEARDLLYERGIDDSQIDVAFADFEVPPAEAIAGEAAAGAYDLVVLSRGEFLSMPDFPNGPEQIAAAVQELSDDGVRLLVT